MLLRFQKAGVRENYETGNEAFSMRLRFLTIRGIEAMHKRFGRLPFRELFRPAISYAENGVTISPLVEAPGIFDFATAY